MCRLKGTVEIFVVSKRQTDSATKCLYESDGRRAVPLVRVYFGPLKTIYVYVFVHNFKVNCKVWPRTKSKT